MEGARAPRAVRRPVRTAPTVAGDSVFARSLGELVRVDWKTEPASTTATPAGPTIASPTLARFLEELERAPTRPLRWTASWPVSAADR